MISINPITFFPRSNIQLLNKPGERVSETKENIASKYLKQTVDRFDYTRVFNQLPKGALNETTQILRRISNRALEAAELGQFFKNRLALQDSISEDISDLKTALSKFPGDDLKLFTAMFQNQLVAKHLNLNTNQNNINSDFVSNETLKYFPENLFQIDVTSESGILVALNLTGNILNLLPSRNSGSSFLESLLNSLTDFNFNIPGIDRIRQSLDITNLNRNTGISRLLSQTLNVYPFTQNANMATIIDLVG